MAAIVRGGHARQGGRGRAHGGGGPRGARAAAEPAQVLNPVGFQWDFWKEGNCNTSGKVNKEMELEMKIYRVLEKDPRVHPDELHSYGVAAGLLTQADDVVRMLHDVVALYNKMAKTRRWFLYRKIQGAWGKEMSSLLKTIQSDGESVVSMVDDIKAANGFCPPTPTVFKALPKLN